MKFCWGARDGSLQWPHSTGLGYKFGCVRHCWALKRWCVGQYVVWGKPPDVRYILFEPAHPVTQLRRPAATGEKFKFPSLREPHLRRGYAAEC